MCGIYGIVSNQLASGQIRHLLSQMRDCLRHRGPDDLRENAYSVYNTIVGFGFTRLSILDLDTGMQPIQCPTDNTAIICNGQIYNYVELRQTVSSEPFVSKGDAEVGLHLYRKKGPAFLNELNGMYAGAILDPLKRRLLLFRDRFGIKPLYFCENNGRFVFSSEIKAVFKGSEIEKAINRRRVPTYFTYRYVPGSETMFKGIQKLPPGSFLDYDLASGTYSIKRYWDYMLDQENPDMDVEEAADQLYELFSDAVRIRLRSDVEVGCLLSGGIDSSAVCARSAMINSFLKLFTIGFGVDKYNELPLVKEFLAEHPRRFEHARLFASDCRQAMLNELPGIVASIEEPISLGTILPTDQVCRMASQEVKVVLTGEGADEIFAGYRKFMIEMAAAQYSQLPADQQQTLRKTYPELKAYLNNRDPDPAKRYIQTEALFDPSEISRLTGIDHAGPFYSEDARPRLTGTEHPVNEMIAFESRFRLPDYVILRLDKLSMRHSLETRTPLLDHRLAEFAASLPVHLKVNLSADREKYICSHAYLKHGLMNAKNAFRKKQPFTIPIPHWLADAKTRPAYVDDILSGDMIRRQGVLNPDFVTEIGKKVRTEGVGPETLVSEADRLFAVIIFTLWYDAFFM
ncbi:MAG TPA: asparagine synthase (glutamine-hydrolyzing) [Desulfosalsimonadaceae bacterium]|nr:asparagine synthase (glutamine-hydrolyzing) [Desulfosalsimonadaceae bacterium]